MATRKEQIESIVDGMHSFKQKMLVSHLKFSKSNIFSITPSQWAVLGVLMEKKQATVSEIAKSLGITSSASTQLTSGLISLGYLQAKSDASDRRSLILQISNKYKQKIAQIKTKSIERFVTMFDILDDKELATYAKLNKKIVTNILNT